MPRLACDIGKPWWRNLCRSVKPIFDERKRIDILFDIIAMQQLWKSVCNELLVKYNATVKLEKQDWIIEFNDDEQVTLFLLTFS